MAKTRLNAAKREFLINYVNRTITFPKLKEAATKARAAYEGQLIKELNKFFPKKELDILQKYGCATNTSSVYIRVNGVREYITLSGTALMPTQNRYGQDETMPCFDADHRIVALRRAYDEAQREFLKTTETTRDKYCTLINQSMFWEDVVAVWPAVDTPEVRGRIVAANALITLSEEVVRGIQADQ